MTDAMVVVWIGRATVGLAVAFLLLFWVLARRKGK